MDEPPFGSIAGLLGRLQEHGTLQVGDVGVLLIDPLNDRSAADAFPVPLAPGR